MPHSADFPPSPRLLLIGRDLRMHHVLGRLFRGIYEVDHAYSGFLALTLMREQSYGLILVSTQLPGYSSQRLLREIASVPGYAQVPVVGVVPFDALDEEIDVAAQQESYADCLTQPLRAEDVRPRINDLLTEGRC